MSSPVTTPQLAPQRNVPRGSRWRLMREHIPDYLFILPQYLLFIVFLVWPVIRGVQISLYDWKIMAATQRFIGTAHYVEMLRDPMWWKVLGNSFTFTLFVMSIREGSPHSATIYPL